MRFYLDEKLYSQGMATDSADAAIKTDIASGLAGIWAQTRKTASYGLSQMLYTTAITQAVGYANNYNSLPEFLSHQDTLLPLVNRFLLKQAKEALTPVLFDFSTWSLGFEGVWAAAFIKYNKEGVAYKNRVFSAADIFLPLSQ